ncbi:MAG TPA: sulfotransferase [Cyanothece sp. UBA12306]|nr:sulfotransferase [Cyanothece sp. UBA12306]
MVMRLIFNVNQPTYFFINGLKKRLIKLNDSEQKKHFRERKQAKYLLISHTNCGRTWVRIMLSKALQLAYNLKKINLHDCYSLSEKNPNIPSIKAIHERYEQFGTYRHQKVILLVRDPRDAAISRYFGMKSKLEISLNEFIKTGVDDYISFYNDWINHQDIPKDFLLIRYEDLKADTYQELNKIINFLGLEIDSNIIHSAVKYASFENMKKLELNRGNSEVKAGVLSNRELNNPESFKVRKAKIGGYKDYLSQEEIDFIDQQVNNKLNPSYGYHKPEQLIL